MYNAQGSYLDFHLCRTIVVKYLRLGVNYILAEFEE